MFRNNYFDKLEELFTLQDVQIKKEINKNKSKENENIQTEKSVKKCKNQSKRVKNKKLTPKRSRSSSKEEKHQQYHQLESNDDIFYDD